MNTQKIGSTEHTLYESLEELEKLAVPKCRQFNPSALQASVKSKSASWYGTEGNGNDARKKILEGWPELLDKLRPMMNQLELAEVVTPHRAVVRRRKMARGDHGDFLDLQRVNSGELDKAWTRPKKQNLYGVTDRRATIVINVSASAITEFDQVLWRAAAAMKACDLLQSSGRSVEIYSGCSNTNIAAGLSNRSYCRIKEYLQPLQAERLAAMCSLAFLRTYGFVMIGARSEKVNYNLGYPSRGLPAQLQARKDAGELIVELGHCYSFEHARRDLELVHKQLIGEKI